MRLKEHSGKTEVTHSFFSKEFEICLFIFSPRTCLIGYHHFFLLFLFFFPWRPRHKIYMIREARWSERKQKLNVHDSQNFLGPSLFSRTGPCKNARSPMPWWNAMNQWCGSCAWLWYPKNACYTDAPHWKHRWRWCDIHLDTQSRAFDLDSVLRHCLEPRFILQHRFHLLAALRKLEYSCQKLFSAPFLIFFPRPTWKDV